MQPPLTANRAQINHETTFLELLLQGTTYFLSSKFNLGPVGPRLLPRDFVHRSHDTIALLNILDEMIYA